MSNSTSDNDISAISSPLELSDDEIASMSYEEMLSTYSGIQDDEEEEEEEESEEENNSEDIDTDNDPKDQEEESTEEDLDNSSNESDEPKEEESEESNKDESDDVDNKEVNNQTIEYTKLKEINDKIFGEFKANGKTLKVDTVDQVISLMQMGANYTQKMTQIKGELKTAQMLKAHGIDDESQLSFLIDLHKKKPAAIAKLIKDAELDPRLLDDEEADNYTGSNYGITDQQFEFKQVTDDLRSDTTLEYSKMMNEISGFDDSSKSELLKNPHILKELAEHYKDGRFATVMAEIDKRRMFGDKSVSSRSSLDAYVTVGSELYNKPVQQAPVKTEVVATKVVTSKPKVSNNKKIATKVASTGGGKVESNVNFLAMSDEEFEAYAKSQKILR